MELNSRLVRYVNCPKEITIYLHIYIQYTSPRIIGPSNGRVRTCIAGVLRGQDTWGYLYLAKRTGVFVQ